MNKKKLIKGAYILVLIAILIFCIQKIFAAYGGAVYEEDEEWISTAWGAYRVTEDGEVVYDKEGYKAVTGEYTEAETIYEAENNGFYYDDLRDNGWIFCIEKGQQLPSKRNEDEIVEMGTGANKAAQYHNGNTSEASPIAHINDAVKLRAEEANALETSTSASTDKTIKRF